MEISFTGTRIGQASECFVYWKDPMTNDTWGLNFTSPIDAKQFRECCVSIISFSACLRFVYGGKIYRKSFLSLLKRLRKFLFCISSYYIVALKV